MQFHEKYLDVLQNIEFAIVGVYREHSELHDLEVINALEAVIDNYIAEIRGRQPRQFPLSKLGKLVFENVKGTCELRLGRDALVVGDSMTEKMQLPVKTPDEIIACLKKIMNSAKKWNKQGGRQGYLKFVSAYVF